MTREEFARREYELGYQFGAALARGEIKLIRQPDGSVTLWERKREEDK